MKSGWVAAIVMIGAVSMVGCVSQKKYEEAMLESDSVKSELALARAQKIALEQQVKTLKDLNVKFGNEAQVARDELERIQHGRDKERGSIEGRTKELEDRVRQLSFQNRAIRHEYEDVKRHNETLKSLVARYQKELKDQSRSATVVPAPSMPSASSAPSGVPAPPVAQPMPTSMMRAADNGSMLFLSDSGGRLPTPRQAELFPSRR